MTSIPAQRAPAEFLGEALDAMDRETKPVTNADILAAVRELRQQTAQLVQDVEPRIARLEERITKLEEARD
jgi:hypothetical protein